MRRTHAMATAALAICLAGSAQAATIANGSFENGSFVGPLFDTLGAGSTAITGWTVGGVGVDWLGSFMTASDGARSIDMNSTGQGILSQTIATNVGTSYKLTFDLAANTDGLSPAVKELSVAVTGGIPTTFLFTALSTPANPGWVQRSYLFTATSTSSVVSFASVAGTASGAALDNVQIAAVPEAATWAMMIGGFGMAGAAMRRRRRDVATA